MQRNYETELRRMMEKRQSRTPPSPEQPLQLSSRFGNHARHYISLGAGVQSTALYLMAAAGSILPTPQAAIFADTQWEPEYVYHHLAWLQSLNLPIPIITVTAGNLYRNTWEGRRVNAVDDRNPFTEVPTFVKDENGKISIGQRQCTQNYKVKPVYEKIRELLGRPPRTGWREPPHAAVWLGISTDEWMRGKPPREKWVEAQYPLLEAGLNRQQCQQWFKDRYPDRQLLKSSCVGCPYHNNRDWIALQKNAPRQMAAAVRLDAHLQTEARIARERSGKAQYLHRSGKPLGEALALLNKAAEAQPQLPLPGSDHEPPIAFGEECEGYCGL